MCSFAAASSFIAEGYSCNLKDKSYIKGVQIVYLSGKEGDTLTLKINGETIYPSKAYDPEIRILYRGGNEIEGSEIKTDGTANAANEIGLNGKTLGRFPSDGSIGVGIKTSRFKEGENAISVIIGGFWGDGPYSENKPHGLAASNQGKNKDDFILSNIRFLLPDGKQIIPDGFVSYKAKAVGSKEKVIKRYEPYPFKENEPFWLGDGWGTFDTWAGNTTNKNVINSIDQGRLDIPYKVEFLLNYQKPSSEAMFALDTRNYQDGIQTIEAYAGETCIWRRDIIIDNSQPTVTTNLVDQQNIANGFVLKVNFSDKTSGIKTHIARLEGKEIGNATSIKYKLDNLKPGVYSLVLEASDNAGNTIYPCLNFKIVEKQIPNYLFKNDNEGFYLQVNNDDSEVLIYKAEPLVFSSYYGTFSGGKKPASEQPFTELYTYNIAKGLEPVTTTAISGMPYHAFDVDVADVTSNEILFNYQGSTREGERLALKVYDPKTSTWKTLATGIGSVKLLASVKTADYAANGRIRVIVLPDYIDNGSDTIIWITDPQHYTKFADLSDFYYKIYQYAANEYLENNIGYLINTGDLVDDSPSSSLADNQWKIAEKALNYAEDIGVPSGVVSGNHDTGNYPKANYSLFWQYFGADRYRDKPYYGGSLNNNASHYDLITIGNNDLLVLYLGYGEEGTPETVAWANQVLQRYSHRQAIICTHQYLSATTGGYDVTSRANTIFNQIVIPNENVKMLLCGHNNGSVCLKKQIGERVFYELLSDYQFVQLEPDAYYQGNKHYIGTVPFCNGEGYLRSLRFAGNKVQVKTFSPITRGKNPFGIRDEFEIIVELPSSKRIITTQSFSAVTIDEKVETISLSTNEIYTGDYQDDSKALVAAITVDGDTFMTSIVKNDNRKFAKKGEAILLPADLYNLQVLFSQANSLVATDYLNDSYAKLKTCLNEVTTTLTETDLTEKQVAEAYNKLSRSISALQVKDESVIDLHDLQILYDYNLDIAAWVNSAGPIKLNAAGSYLLAEQLQNGGLKINKSSSAPNNWPQMKYKTANITVTPVDSKVYLYLDIDASSSWVLFPVIKQENRSANFRLNYIIEGLTNMEADGGPGIFKGIYDVTEALNKHHFDLTQPLEITMMVNTVPGPVAINRLLIMTNKLSPTIE